MKKLKFDLRLHQLALAINLLAALIMSVAFYGAFVNDNTGLMISDAMLVVGNLLLALFNHNRVRELKERLRKEE